MAGHEQVLGDYVLLEEVGRGAHSVVHRGRRRDRAGRIVAIKRLATTVGADAVTALRREADTLAALAHPAVVPLLDVVDDPDGGGLALVLPWAPGGSLEDVLQREGALPWAQVADLGARLASALASAHGAGILHRDVKPADVLLGAEDEPRLADFGTACLRADAPDAPVGTAEYVDPAVVVEGAPPSPRSDGYSLGVVLYRALSGQLPYAGGSPAATVAAADRGVHPRLVELVPDAPPQLVAAVERAMARDPDARFGSVQQLQVVLEPLVRDHESTRWDGLARQLDPHPPAASAPPPTPPTRPTPPVATPAPAPVAPPSGDSGTQVFGARPPAAPPVGDGAVRPRWAIPAVVGVVLIPIVLVAWLVLAGRDDGPAGAPATPTATIADATPTLRTPPQRCEGVDAPAGADAVLDADVDGRGCALPLAVTEQEVDGEPTLVLTLPEAADELAGRYAIGAPGDVVLVGDWDCDATDTPAVHRPATGEVFLYDGYGQVDPEPGADLPVEAAAVVLTDGDGCDAVAAP